MARPRRPWDAALPTEVRLKMWERRETPDGVELPVGHTMRQDQRIPAYPWKDMQVGDYFYAMVGKSRNSTLTTLRQAAARWNIEICIVPKKLGDGTELLRVCKILEGVRQLKAKSSRILGRRIPASDGRWKEQRALSKKLRRGEATDPRPKPAVAASAPISAPPVDVGAAVTPDVGYDRSERLRRVKEAARKELGLEKKEVNYFEETDDA